MNAQTPKPDDRRLLAGVLVSVLVGAAMACFVAYLIVAIYA